MGSIIPYIQKITGGFFIAQLVCLGCFLTFNQKNNCLQRENGGFLPGESTEKIDKPPCTWIMYKLYTAKSCGFFGEPCQILRERFVVRSSKASSEKKMMTENVSWFF